MKLRAILQERQCTNRRHLTLSSGSIGSVDCGRRVPSGLHPVTHICLFLNELGLGFSSEAVNDARLLRFVQTNVILRLV